jgi:hypothetical protein
MKIVLVIFFLSVQSSYLSNSEEDATDEVFDTVQFVATETGAWRIRTYATDQDVHVWSVGSNQKDIVALARANTEKHYGDVLTEGYIIETVDGIEGVRRELRERGLSDHLEVSKTGMLFWAPEGTDYRSRSDPRS